MQDNQASVGWGDLDTALIYLLQVVRSHRGPIYYTDQIQRSLDCNVRKRSPPKICEEEIEDQE